MSDTPRIITVSGRIAVGTSTLARNLKNTLGWDYVNAGEIQRRYDREHGVDEHSQGALQRSDEHEREIDAATVKMLKEKDKLIYEAWLAGFMAKDIDGVLKVLLVCDEPAVRIDRIVNRENISIEEAKKWIGQREQENIEKWKKLYGDHDFWDPKYYDLVIDTYESGPLETVGRVLDRAGLKAKLEA